MATAEEGGPTVNATSSSYGGQGAGGKFRKKPFRISTTPYDRPPTVPRGNNGNNSSWLKKLVVQPASKLMSYGAERFFAPLLRKRLPPPPRAQPPEAKADASDGIQGDALNNLDGPQEPVSGDCSQPINSSSHNDISELEQLLKQRTFSRSEIVHLKELLQSKAAEVSPDDVGQKNKESASDDARDQQFGSGILEENRNGCNKNRSSVFMSIPIDNSKVVVDDNASPAELAKAYMGTRPSKVSVSPSVLGIRSRVGKGDARLLSGLPYASGSPILALTKKTLGSTVAPDNGFIITPRSRSRSAIYNMARTPYSKGSGMNQDGYAGPGRSVSSSFLSPVDNGEKFDSLPMTLKRRSSVLDDELGSISPTRRIRQKPNLAASGLHNTNGVGGIGSHAKQKFPLIIKQSHHNASMDVGENENRHVPISSYPRVPSKSIEVASRILQHLEKMTPQEKSSEPKLVARKEKSSLTLTPSMLSGQALRSMEDMDSSKLLDVQDNHKLGDRSLTSNITLADARDFAMRKKGKIEENGSKEYFNPSDKWYPLSNNDSVVSLKASMPSTSAGGSIVETGASHPQKKRAFRMSAQEDFSEQDDDSHCNGLVSIPISKNNGPVETFLTDSKTITPTDEPKLIEPSMRAENQSSFPINSRNTSAHNGQVVRSGEVSTVVSLSTSDETTEASQRGVLPPAVTSSDKPKDANNFLLCSLSSKVVEKVSFAPSGFTKEADSKIQSSRSLVHTPPGSENKVSESDKNSLNVFKAGDANDKSNTVLSAASKGPSLSSGAPPMFSTISHSNDTNHVLEGSSDFMFNSSSCSTSTSTCTTTTTTTTPATSMFGLTAVKPLIPAGSPFFKMGASADPPTSASTSISQAESNAGNNKNETSAAAFAPTGSVSNTTFGLGSSAATQTSFNFSSSSLFSASSGSQVSKTSVAFGSTHPTSSSDNTVTPSVVNFSANSTEATVVSSISASQPTTTPGIFTSGLGFSSPSCTAVGSSTRSVITPVCAATNSISTANAISFGGNISSTPPTSGAPSDSNPFITNWQNPKPSSIFDSSNTFTSGFSFGASSSSTAPSTSVFNSSSSSAAPFSFHAIAPPPAPVVLGSPDQMNADDMAEDHPMQQQQQQQLIVPMIFGQPGVVGPTTSPPAFGFGQLGQPSQSPFVFGGQPNQVGATVPQNPNPFQASSSLEFNTGGSFSLGSGGGDKSGRKFVKISRSKNRKK